ncbi:hypothetical protein L6452_21966 [Arctium lappa]|uniref:Uncharacterized protein n=1 Tax=Arctium lappa TaxID=4217 RepID=A0ACB9AYV5_ARCLA|nr:hypothetical protein L6452_21966 [Arctium lappa]
MAQPEFGAKNCRGAGSEVVAAIFGEKHFGSVLTITQCLYINLRIKSLKRWSGNNPNPNSTASRRASLRLVCAYKTTVP